MRACHRFRAGGGPLSASPLGEPSSVEAAQKVFEDDLSAVGPSLDYPTPVRHPLNLLGVLEVVFRQSRQALLGEGCLLMKTVAVGGRSCLVFAAPFRSRPFVGTAAVAASPLYLLAKRRISMNPQ